MSSPSAPPVAFTPLELRASLSLAGVYGLRMLGLFLMLPVLSLCARDLPGGDDPAWVGLALGIYGLTQALLQIPFGMASDRWGRRPVIVVGLLLFVLGSLLAASAESVTWLIVGRALQGSGAVSAAVSAYLADLTRDEVRTRSMALVGASIGLSFAVSLVVAPPLYGWVGLAGLFLLTAALALGAAWMVLRMPDPEQVPSRLDGDRLSWGGLLRDSQLSRLNLGVFFMMAIQTAMFVAIPRLLESGGLSLTDHWMVYLPVLLLAFAAMVPPILWAERRGQFRPVFVGSVGVLALAMLAFLGLPPVGPGPLWPLVLAVWIFVLGFNLLEALLPSWVSRVAPRAQRGQAMGLYNTFQSMGLFAGGLLGGLLARSLGLAGIFWACLLVTLVWGIMSLGLRELGPRSAGR